MTNAIQSGANLAKALKIAKALGFTCEIVYRTGDGKLSHPLLDFAVRFNSRRKDAPRAVTDAIRKVQSASHD